ncbi:hypothetical protein FZ103_19080 [Streptomonospora sp. PA3]|uniref:hypothetical protein n=1 Tax=Streptomonospora sp. PA3 TaxID=2607326 RepID=UPI0012DBD7E0|nr:hypothetical protein [Streptomonospora sp. PA3]MUL43244.1 hypothetical protein [Streptomonospora sp. PA3]
MGVDERDVRRATADVHFQPVGGKVGYASACSGPVHYRTIAGDSGAEVLGYLWYCDAEEAAGYVPRPEGGDAAFNAGAYWADLLAGAWQRGLPPSAAVDEFESRSAGGPASGWIVPDASGKAPGVQELRTAVGLSPSGNRPPQQADEPQRRRRSGE